MTNGKILLVVQRNTSDPGRIGAMLGAMGYGLEICVPSAGDALPATLDDYAGAVVFGGPMSANDDRTLPFIRLELEWIPTAIDSGKPFLGICLGCQLLARALGARVGPHPDGLHEIGYFKLQPTAAGRGLFDDPLYVYEWHGEGFEVPAGGELLAEGEYFVNQAFRYGGTAYGLQFHPEVTSGMMARWTRLAAHRMSLPGAQARDEQLSKHEAHEGAFVTWLESFLERWLGREEEAARPVDAALAVASGD